MVKRAGCAIQGQALGLGDGLVNDLANLPPCGVVARPELQAVGTAAVPRDYAYAVGGLYVLVEDVRGWYISESGEERVYQVPTSCNHDYLG